MNKRIESSQGFTLAELLIVVAIIAVLVAIAIPAFAGSLEKSREATDAANVRSACSQVATAAMLRDKENDTVHIDGKGTYYTYVPLIQEQEGWQTEELAFGDRLGSVRCVGKPKPGTNAKVTCDANLDVVVYWSGSAGVSVSDSAKDYKPALEAVISSVYDGLVANRLANSNNHISWVLIKNGKVTEAHYYGTEADKNGNANANLTPQELDALNSSIAKALDGTGYRLSTNSTARLFFDWNGNVVPNDRANGAPAIGGQGANATVDFMPTNSNKKQTVTNATGEWTL